MEEAKQFLTCNSVGSDLGLWPSVSESSFSYMRHSIFKLQLHIIS
jgi:hypothetical protein